MKTREDRYSREIYLIIGKYEKYACDPIFRAYLRKWGARHHDPFLQHINGDVLLPEDNPDDIKFSFLKNVDSHSRITIVAGHKVFADDFHGLEDGAQHVHYKKIIDIIRFHSSSPSVLLKNVGDANVAYQRALRIRLVACMSGYGDGEYRSIAEKMLLYAANHANKALRIEVVAPRMICYPSTFSLDRNFSIFSLNRKTRQGEYDVGEFHKLYSALSRGHGKIVVSEWLELPTAIWPKYRPTGYKLIYKIDDDRSRPGHVVHRHLSPEEDRYEMQQAERAELDALRSRFVMKQV